MIVPYRAQLGKKKLFKPEHIVEVFQLKEDGTESYLGNYTVHCWKTPLPLFCPILRNGKWYVLNSQSCGIRVLSLPDLKEVAVTNNPKDYVHTSKVTDIYVPRMQHTTKEYYNEDGSHWFTGNFTLVDERIENPKSRADANLFVSAPAWEHANFAFVESYDPLCSGTNWCRLLDLSKLESGIITFKDFLVDIPNWLTLKECIDLQHWTKEFPTFSIASERHFATPTGNECGDSGWVTKDFENS